jgi:hypothetical protein
MTSAQGWQACGKARCTKFLGKGQLVDLHMLKDRQHHSKLVDDIRFSLMA